MAGDDLLEEEAAHLAHRILGCIGHVRRTPQGPRAENLLKFPTPALPGSGSKGLSLTRETLSPSGLPKMSRAQLRIRTFRDGPFGGVPSGVGEELCDVRRVVCDRDARIAERS